MAQALASKVMGVKEVGETQACAIAVVKAGGVSIPLKTAGGVVLNIDDEPAGKIIEISGCDAFMPDVIVRTTVGCIRRTMKEMSKKEARHTFTGVWNAIKNVNTDELYAEQGERWQNLMDDILLYYICRYKIFGTPFPQVLRQ